MMVTVVMVTVVMVTVVMVTVVMVTVVMVTVVMVDNGDYEGANQTESYTQRGRCDRKNS